ncbi:hypothetical protein CDAR_247081 [Caerostris darwini]|uniref:Uncharacterized protein n=1 Tax=Caerostris darwini TaxID=1538125 RepID=A0AAV4W0A0_9ARAC|nr:hypothetical protein CDAR_247081 [Caerostris darwini]
MKQIAATHRKRRNASFEKLLEDYSNIKSVVQQIDKSIGLLLFISIIITSSFMCFSIYVILNPKVLEGSFLRFQTYCNFLGNFILFILTTASATMVEEASLEVGSQALTVSKSEENLSLFNKESDVLSKRNHINSVENRSYQKKFRFWYNWNHIDLHVYVLWFESMKPDGRE